MDASSARGSRSASLQELRVALLEASRIRAVGHSARQEDPHSSFERDGFWLTSRPQLYVDLVRRGGAAAEAAAFLRERGELWPR